MDLAHRQSADLADSGSFVGFGPATGTPAAGRTDLLDARLGLNTEKVLRPLIAGDGAIGINNAIVAFDFDKGLGKSTAILQPTFSLIAQEKQPKG
jgi:hypothetical protein